MSKSTYTAEQFLVVLRDLYKYTNEADKRYFQQHHKALWVLPLVFGSDKRFVRMVALESQFRQALNILRLMSTGVPEDEFDADIELIMTVLAMNSELRDSIHHVEGTFRTVGWELCGFEYYLRASVAGIRGVRKHYFDTDQLDLHDIMVGGERVTPETMGVLAEAIEAFVKT